QIPRGLPDFGKCHNARLAVSSRTRGRASGNPRLQRTAQQPNGILAVVTAHLAELLHSRLLSAPPPAVALIDGSQILPPGLSRHTKFLHHLPSFSCHHASKEG